MADFGAIRALAFDLDGTLVDSAPGLAAAIDMALEETGLPQAGKERVGTWIGNGADVLVQRAALGGRRGTPEQCGRLRERFDHFYAQTVDSGSRLFPQVQETLARLAARLPDGAGDQQTDAVRGAAAGGAGHWLFLAGDRRRRRDGKETAPGVVSGARQAGCAHELLFVGDSRNDIQAAQGAGCPSVGFTYGYNYGESIALSHPDRVLERFADLLPALGCHL